MQFNESIRNDPEKFKTGKITIEGWKIKTSRKLKT